MDFARTAHQIRRHMEAYDFSKRERRVIGALLRLSLDLGRAKAIVPKLEDLAGVAGLTKGNVSETIADLKRAGIVRANFTPENFTEFLVVSDPAFWLGLEPAGDWTSPSARQLVALNVRGLQPDLIAEEPGLAESLASLESPPPVPESGTPFPKQEQTPFPNREPVPETGTGKTPVSLAHSRSVPESGTTYVRTSLRDSRTGLVREHWKQRRPDPFVLDRARKSGLWGEATAGLLTDLAKFSPDEAVELVGQADMQHREGRKIDKPAQWLKQCLRASGTLDRMYPR